MAGTKHKTQRVGHLFKLLALTIVVWLLVAWVAAKALIVNAALPRAEAIVMLSGSSAYIERAKLAAKLFADGRAPKIILTDDGGRGGWSNTEQRNPFFVELEASELRRAGVPPNKIETLPQRVSSTYEEALLLREYAVSHGTRSLLFVTSAYHSRRALWTLRRIFGSGIHVGLESVPTGDNSPSPLTWWLSVSGWRAVAGEYVKFAYYLWRYSSRSGGG